MKKFILIIDLGQKASSSLLLGVLEKNAIPSVVLHANDAAKWLQTNWPCGIILNGGPNGIHETRSVTPHVELQDVSLPKLGIGFGMHWLAYMRGGCVEERKAKPPYSVKMIQIKPDNPLFFGLSPTQQVCGSNCDIVTGLPDGFEEIASHRAEITGMYSEYKLIFGIQFRPEVFQTPNGAHVLCNFAFDVCHVKEPELGRNKMADKLVRTH